MKKILFVIMILSIALYSSQTKAKTWPLSHSDDVCVVYTPSGSENYVINETIVSNELPVEVYKTATFALG